MVTARGRPTVTGKGAGREASREEHVGLFKKDR